MLYILTSICFLPTPSDGCNIRFSWFSHKNAKKEKKNENFLFFFLFNILCVKNMKKHISISIWSAQQPNANQNITQTNVKMKTHRKNASKMKTHCKNACDKTDIAEDRSRQPVLCRQEIQICQFRLWLGHHLLQGHQLFDQHHLTLGKINIRVNLMMSKW